MAQSWEDFKREQQKKFGTIKPEDIKVIEPPIVARPRYEEPIPAPTVKLFNVHKRTLPPGIDKIVVFGVEKSEAQWWIDHKLKPKSYQDDARETKTLVYYDIVPVDATPRERSIYFNTRPVTTTDAEKYSEFKSQFPDVEFIG